MDIAKRGRGILEVLGREEWLADKDCVLNFRVPVRHEAHLSEPRMG